MLVRRMSRGRRDKGTQTAGSLVPAGRWGWSGFSRRDGYIRLGSMMVRAGPPGEMCGGPLV